MPVTVQCDQCGLQYAAPDALIGKRVRCKRCSAVFTVVEASPDAAPPQPQSPDADSVALSEMDDIDAILRGSGGAQADETASPGDIVRTVQPFDYPYSREVERFLPIGLLAVALLLIISQTLAQDDLGRPWLAAVRLVILLGLYAVIVFPITYVGVRHGVRKQGGHMPWSPAWKTFAIFIIAYALSYMLWLAGTNIASLLLGCLVGLSVALTALWLVFRLRLEKGLEPLIWSGVAFVAAVLLAGGFLAGLNLTTFAVTTGSQTAHTFSASPILPGLPWDPLPPPEQPDPPMTPPLPPVEVATPEVPDESDTPDTQADSPVVAINDNADDTPADPISPSQSDSSAAGAPQTPDPTDDAALITPPIVDQPEPRDDAVAADTTDSPADSPGQSAIVTLPQSELVEIDHPPLAGGFKRIVHPLADGDYVAVIREDGEDDFIERWRIADWTRTAQARFRPDPNIGEQYAISPDGARLARIVTWPTLSIQTWAFDEQRVSEMLELDADIGQPSLLGFVSPTQLLLSWQNKGAHGIQLLDLQTRRRAFVVLDGVQTLDRNFALSPDGRMFAVAGRLRDGPGVIVYNVGALAGGRPMRAMPIRLLDPRWGVQPAGLAFSADGTELAAYFEQDGNGLLLSWTMPLGREIQPHVFPAGSIPPRQEIDAASVFSYLADGEVLLHGRDVIDTRTGRLLGSTGIETALSQRLTADGAYVVYIDSDGLTQLGVLTRNKPTTQAEDDSSQE